jgi:hypothetical protein
MNAHHGYCVLMSLMQGWKRVKAGQRQPDGCLQYELADGTTGLARPKKWCLAYEIGTPNFDMRGDKLLERLKQSG